MRSFAAAANLLLAGLLISGCQHSAQQISQPITGNCNAQAVQGLLGKTASPALLEEARKQSGAETARMLRPDDVVTLEYNGKRLNLYTDQALTIQRVNCG